MKLRGFQCDRCGKKYDKNRSKDYQHRTEYNLTSVGLINTAGQIFRTDLCDECLAELQTWLNDTSNTVSKKDDGCECGCCSIDFEKPSVPVENEDEDVEE